MERLDVCFGRFYVRLSLKKIVEERRSTLLRSLIHFGALLICIDSLQFFIGSLSKLNLIYYYILLSSFIQAKFCLSRFFILIVYLLINWYSRQVLYFFYYIYCHDHGKWIINFLVAFNGTYWAIRKPRMQDFYYYKDF